MADRTGQHPPASFLDARFDDFDALAEAVQGWDLDWQQLDRGRLQASLQQVRTPSALMTRVGFSRQYFQRGGTPPGFLTFGLLRNGVGEINWCGQGGGSNDLLIFRSGGEYESMSPPGFGANTLSYSQDLLDGISRSLGLPEVDRILSGSNQLQTCRPGAMAHLRAELKTVFDRAAADPSVLTTRTFRHQIEEKIATLLVEALVSEDRAGREYTSSGRSRLVRDAVSMITARSKDPVTVQEICAVVGVSERTLQYAFREQLEITPKQYLQSVRLNGVRRDLQRAEAEVRIADVANRWGFWHLGQFARHYRRQFGELPSETRSRA